MDDVGPGPEALAERDGVEYYVERHDVDADAFEGAKTFVDRVAGLVGAAVVDDERLLVIRHEDYGGWVLPGGRAERWETLREAAVREVAEETGVTASVGDPLLVVRSVYRHRDRSTAGYFVLFEATAVDPATADDPGLADESISEVRWVRSIPEPTPDDETVRRTLSTVRDRFAWLE